jgi:hypothetical protein
MKKLMTLFIAYTLMTLSTSSIAIDMKTMMHVSPLPSLMMLTQSNSHFLELSKQQKHALMQWQQQNNQPQKQLVQQILDLESALKELALAGAGKQAIAEERDLLLEARGKLIDKKQACISNLQKTLSEEQWQILMELYEEKVAAMMQPKGGNEAQAFLRISPFPKYMLIVLMHGPSLALNAEQEKALEAWRTEHMNPWSIMFEQVLQSEKAITEASLKGATAQELIPEYQKIFDTRKRMTTMSAQCADNMKKVLTKEQWQKMVSIYRKLIDLK